MSHKKTHKIKNERMPEMSKPNRLAWLEHVNGAIRGPKPKVKTKTTVTIPERDLQQMAENLCNALQIRFFRIPDKLLAFLRCYAPPWTRVFIARYLAGVPDLMLFKKLSGLKNEVCFIEIKTEKGTLHQSQKTWHSGLNVIVTHGWAETENVIKEFAK